MRNEDYTKQDEDITAFDDIVAVVIGGCICGAVIYFIYSL